MKFTKQIIDILTKYDGWFVSSKKEQIANEIDDLELNPPEDLLKEFKEECLKYPNEPVKDLWGLAKGWYEMKDFPNEPFNGPIKL